MDFYLYFQHLMSDVGESGTAHYADEHLFDHGTYLVIKHIDRTLQT
jgi:hypothetical protein